jgi:glycosyltransferase involved in cell wall biosynthesis
MNLKILIDWKYDNALSIEKELSDQNISYSVYDIPNYSMKDRTNKYRLLILYTKYMIQAAQAVSQSTLNDIIVCENFTASIAAGIVSKILRKRCIILGINCITPPRIKIVNLLRYIIYHNVMKSDKFFTTVNSEEYIAEYSSMYKIDKNKFFVLHDSTIEIPQEKEFIHRKSYVFCGGEAQRDWTTMIKASKECPELKFIFVARKKYFEQNLVVPDNAQILFDIEKKDFYEYLENSSLVAMPLQTELPAGLIVLLNCALYRKPVITTRTPSTSNYIENNKSGFLVNMFDYKELAVKIKQLYSDSILQEQFTDSLFETVVRNHSPEIRNTNLLRIINKIGG